GIPCIVLAMSRAPLDASAYRTARRVIGIAQRLALPLVTLVDSPGADPSEESENAGIAWEIAATFDAFADVNVPVLSIVVGEGGSGGALAFSLADRLLVYE